MQAEAGRSRLTEEQQWAREQRPSVWEQRQEKEGRQRQAQAGPYRNAPPPTGGEANTVLHGAGTREEFVREEQRRQTEERRRAREQREQRQIIWEQTTAEGTHRQRQDRAGPYRSAPPPTGGEASTVERSNLRRAIPEVWSQQEEADTMRAGAGGVKYRSWAESLPASSEYSDFNQSAIEPAGSPWMDLNHGAVQEHLSRRSAEVAAGISTAATPSDNPPPAATPQVQGPGVQ